ncbi:DNA-directed RNA polymerase II subunit GRINL1A [Chelonus insularis]|uniref:DNA-directed RNA polymerase II subunit GRINL1A n=1 Tax=Chelonus insularis TaxID=460826 RepID=UPI00158F2022|nr:DNA-directed RNA polymerase II subunit GRINL1A-like [Chelonus insularis]
MCANISQLTIDTKINTRNNDGPVNLNNKSLIELQDLLERQDAILKNKKFLKLLPDKGEKILTFRTKIENEIHLRNEIIRSNELMSALNISADKHVVEELEWKRNFHNHLTSNDVENDETDVLKILSESAGLGNCKKEKNDTSIKLRENTSSTETLSEEESSKYPECTRKLIKKTTNENQSPSKKEPFKPHKSIKSGSKNKKNDPGINQTSNSSIAIKFLDLNESIKVEEEYNEKIQEIKIKHAIERLSASNAVHTLEVLTDARTDDNDLCSSNQEVESTENISEDEQDFEHENDDD